MTHRQIKPVLTQPRYDATPRITQPIRTWGATAAGNGKQLISKYHLLTCKATCEIIHANLTKSYRSYRKSDLFKSKSSQINKLAKMMSNQAGGVNQVKIKEERACGQQVFIITIYATKTNPLPNERYQLPKEDDTTCGLEVFLYGIKDIGGLELPSACRRGSATSIRDVSDHMSVADQGWNIKALSKGGRKFCIKYHINSNHKAVVVSSINDLILTKGTPELKLPLGCQADKVDEQEWTYELLTSRTKLNSTQKWTSLKNEGIKKIHDLFDVDGSKTIKAALKKANFQVTSTQMTTITLTPSTTKPTAGPLPLNTA